MSRFLLKPKNWSTFQHYKDRCPPWVKLHHELLDDRAFQRLHVASRALAPMLWLLASEAKDGVFDATLDELVFRLRQPTEEILSGLKHLIDAGFFEVISDDAINTLAGRRQVAVPEAEAEAEAEAEESLLGSANPTDDIQKTDRVPPCPFDRLFDSYEKHLPSMPSVRRGLFKSGKNATALRQRWAWVMTSSHERGERKGQPLASTLDEGVGWFDRYFDYVADSKFLTEEFNGCDLAWLVGKANFEKVLNGRYENRKGVAA